jgi:hypothetical protein
VLSLGTLVLAKSPLLALILLHSIIVVNGLISCSKKEIASELNEFLHIALWSEELQCTVNVRIQFKQQQNVSHVLVLVRIPNLYS